MVNRSSTTAPSYKGDVGAAKSRKVHFFPGILISSNHDARIVAIDEQEGFLGRLLLEEPVYRKVFVPDNRIYAERRERTSPRMRG
jgi:hypothetical protein